MNSTTRSLWIFVLIALLAMCLCAAALGALAAGVFTFAPLERAGLGGRMEERLEQSFPVSGTPALEVDNFAGTVRVQAGGDDAIRVMATKKARGESSLASIKIEMAEREGGLMVRTSKPTGLDNASVDLEITAPAGTRLNVRTGAGTVEVTGLRGPVTIDSGAGTVKVRDVRGEIEARSGAGTIDVEGAVGVTRLTTGAGMIAYEGTPQGECRFESGAGRIELTLPADLSARVDLEAGLGTVEVAFDVAGQVSRRSVQGTIGRGDQATIYARSGTGSIEVKRR